MNLRGWIIDRFWDGAREQVDRRRGEPVRSRSTIRRSGLGLTVYRVHRRPEAMDSERFRTGAQIRAAGFLVEIVTITTAFCLDPDSHAF